MPKKIILDNIPCKDHVTRIICMFCQTCDCLVCTECVSTNHSRHQFVPLETTVEEKLHKLRSAEANIMDDLKYCDSKIEEIQNIRLKYQSIFDDSINKIQQKERELKDAISKYSTTLQTQVNNERAKAEYAVTKIEQHVDRVRKGLEKQRGGIENTLKSTQGAEIFETEIPNHILDVTYDSLPKEVEHFHPTTEQKTQIQILFGSLQKIKIPIVRELIDLQVLRTFTTDLPQIYKLLVETETAAWIGNYSTKVIRKIDIIGKNITIQEVNTPFFDIGLTVNNDIIYSDFEKSNVKLLSQSGEIKPFLTMKHLLPRGIHATKNDEVIVGVREKGDPEKVNKQSKRAIMVFDMNGKQKHTFQYDKNGQRLFTVPIRITTSMNQDILVIDSSSGHTGRVVCLDREGNVKFIYKGDTEINAKEQFDPRDVAITSVGHIIVSDFSSHALHVLSGTGDRLFCKLTRDLGIVYPWSIDIDRKGQLWVGCGTGPDQKLQTGAKIHIVKLYTR